MKNQQLYKLIEDLIAQKKKLPIDISSQTFAENYCRKQIIKRKLLPYDPNFKMNRIMRNFQGLQTYISLQEILLKMRKEQNNKSTNDDNLNHPQQAEAQKQTVSLQNLIKQKMSSYSISKAEKQVKNIQAILQYLESNSSLHSQLLKNNSHFLNCDIFDDIQRQSQEHQQDNEQICFKNRLTTIQQNMRNKPLQKRSKSSQLLSNSIKKRQLLFKMSIYLQMILQNQHKIKWNKENCKMPTFHLADKKTRFPTRNNSNFSSQHRKGSHCKNSFTTFFMTNHQRDSLRKQSTSENFKNQSKSKFNKTNARPKKFKDLILNKLSSFISEIQDQEYIMKQRNKKYMKEIDRVQKKVQNLFNYEKEEPLAGEQDLEDVKKMASSFRKRKLR